VTVTDHTAADRYPVILGGIRVQRWPCVGTRWQRFGAFRIVEAEEVNSDLFQQVGNLSLTAVTVLAIARTVKELKALFDGLGGFHWQGSRCTRFNGCHQLCLVFIALRVFDFSWTSRTW